MFYSTSGNIYLATHLLSFQFVTHAILFNIEELVGRIDTNLKDVWQNKYCPKLVGVVIKIRYQTCVKCISYLIIL